MPSTDIDGSTILIVGEPQVKKILDYMIYYKAETTWTQEDRDFAARILRDFPHLRNIATKYLLEAQ